MTWIKTSWREKPITQQAEYAGRKSLESSMQKLQQLPPLVTAHEIDKLRQDLRRVAEGEAFLLQGGDCAELFEYCSQEPIEAKLRLLLQMSLVLIWGANTPVVRIARMAGQFAKPRSKPLETVDGQSVPSYRGDIINGFGRDEREPNPQRLVDAYFHSAATLNFMRGLLASGFADLHHPLDWSLAHVRCSQVRSEYQAIVDSLTSALSFMKVIDADSSNSLGTADIYASHEGLVLDYEESLTRQLKGADGQTRWYDTSAHFLWIGDRTRQLDNAHIEFFRGIANPLGVKVGPSMQPSELARLLDILDPACEPGRVTLITRYGKSQIAACLPAHIAAVMAGAHRVVWMCDPMHGNTGTSESGLKTRQFQDIMAEITLAIQIHEAAGSRLNGVHLELTGDPVTECVGGSEELTSEDLAQRYTTYCDPRLNEKQALDVAFLVAAHYRRSE